ncbi:Hypp811 [Branchiostoma lanceolatum]|uniref:Hypp811 protein n=1 Tax=Branchiostoma lanceolatum TaxID=7740 RepID=A0A8J9YKF3_BRALA|nr:Hypp811 [Branchiostoma lanceolatum]
MEYRESASGIHLSIDPWNQYRLAMTPRGRLAGIKKTNFVFIKAGGTAMCQLFFRFGLRHRLNFVLPFLSDGDR